MGEVERISVTLAVGSDDDRDALRRTIHEQANEIDSLRQHIVAASQAVNAQRKRADENARSLARAVEERTQAWTESERLGQALGHAEAENVRIREAIAALHAELAKLRNGAPAAAEELASIKSSRWYRAMRAYHRLYDRPALGPTLHRLRRLIGRVVRWFR